jgi:hypothetical protein
VRYCLAAHAQTQHLLLLLALHSHHSSEHPLAAEVIKRSAVPEVSLGLAVVKPNYSSSSSYSSSRRGAG